MPRKSSAAVTRRSPESSIPASEVRPIVPAVESTPAPDPKKLIRAARAADEYAAIRAQAEVLRERLAPVALELIQLMKETSRRSFQTGAGIVTLLPATADGETLDQDKAIELLLAHEEKPPMKTRKGMPDRLEFRPGNR